MPVTTYRSAVLAALLAAPVFCVCGLSARAQDAQVTATAADSAATAVVDEPLPPPPEPAALTEEELEILVARIALYPDDLVAAIIAASLHPLDIVQAQRFLDKARTEKDLEPDADWDGSVIALLNTPEIVTMMSDDLDWTEMLGDAVAYQEKDVLAAIQQLRDRAVAKGVLKSDDKTVVVKEQTKVVIQPAEPTQVYVPVYEPQMLYEPAYVPPPQPITYYSDPYPSYYYPTASYFPAFVTGAVWGAVVDWDDWGVWDGDIDFCCGGDIDIDIDFNRVDWDRVDWDRVDWDRVDWSKARRNDRLRNDNLRNVRFDRDRVRENLKRNDDNRLQTRARETRNDRSRPASATVGRGSRDVRKVAHEGSRDRRPGAGRNDADRRPSGNPDRDRRPAANDGGNRRPAANDGGNRRPGASADRDRRPNDKMARPGGGRPDSIKKRPVTHKKPGVRKDARPSRPSPLGDVKRGRDSKFHSARGGKSMGGGMKLAKKPGGRGGKSMHKMKRGGKRR